jgi:hypothetical protein
MANAKTAKTLRPAGQGVGIPAKTGIGLDAELTLLILPRTR